MKLWGVVDCNGRMWIRSIRKTRRDAIEGFLAFEGEVWSHYYRRGYRCKRITVTVEGES